ncbi:tetratricopeptide repeat protein [Lentibacillus sp. N15]|uniref:tetratricopeptide repeat protein n=1 Tax=Lentibacillus songyuanensis TaxID=3136161 RepID=UPI0031BBA00F
MQQLKSKIQKNNKPNNVLPFIPEGDFYFTKGVEAFQKRKFDLSLKWFQKAIEQKPNDPLYHCQMSIVYTEIGAYHAANQLLTEVIQFTQEEYMDCYYLLANNYAHLGLLQDAKKYALSYLDKEPDGDFSEEAKSLLELIDIDEDEEEWDLEEEDELLIYQETVFYHMENLEWDKALPLIEEMMTVFPEYTAVRHDYAEALFHSGFPEKAIQIEHDLLKEDPNSLVSRSNLAIFCHAHNQRAECETYVQALLHVYPIQEQQKLRIAVTLAKIGLHADAVPRFHMLAKGIVKNHPSYYRWYSRSLSQVGNTEKALKLWEEGCKKHPKLVREGDLGNRN